MDHVDFIVTWKWNIGEVCLLVLRGSCLLNIISHFLVIIIIILLLVISLYVICKIWTELI